MIPCSPSVQFPNSSTATRDELKTPLPSVKRHKYLTLFAPGSWSVIQLQLITLIPAWWQQNSV